MAIIRAPRPDTGYTIIRNDVLRDARLSYRARGLLAEILSRPDNWRIDSRQLADHAKEGREAIRTALREIEAAGYIKRAKRQDPDTGQWTTDTTVYDTPVADTVEAPTPGEPAPRNPTPGNPYSGFLGTNRKNIKKEHKEASSPRSKSAVGRDGLPTGEKAATTTDETEHSITLTRVVDAWKNAATGKSAQAPAEVRRIASTALANGVAETALTAALIAIAREGHAVKDWRLTEALNPQPRRASAVRKTRTLAADAKYTREAYEDTAL